MVSICGNSGGDSMENSTNITITFHYKGDIISNETLNIVKIVCGMALLLPVSILGIIGNVVSLVVLCCHKVKTASNYCLTALAFSDLLFLINAVLFSAINIYVQVSPREGTNLRNSLFPYVGIYSSLVTARITSLLTTLLSIERFVAVRFPMKAKFICNKKSTFIAIVTIYLVTIILFLPFPFKYKIIHKIERNVSITSVVRNLKLSDQFCKIYGITMNFIFRFIPILLIFCLNIIIMFNIWSTRKKRKSLSTRNISESQSKEQRKITIMLLVVSFTFLICILPGAINSLFQTTFKGYSRLGKSRNFQQSFSYVTFLLEAINSALNFLIYMALSARFYEIYKEIFYSAKNIIRRVSFGSFSRDKSSFAIRRKCESQSSFTYSDEVNHQRMTSRQHLHDSHKSLLDKAGNSEPIKRENSNKHQQTTNGILYELSENNSKPDGYTNDTFDENGYINMKSLRNHNSHESTRLVKQDTFETSIND